MNNQKVNFIPTVNGVPITNYALNGEVFLDVIDMPEANKPWSLQIMATSEGIVYGEISFLAGNSLDLDFVKYMDSITIDRTLTIISEPEFNYRYMFLQISLAGGSVSLSMVK